MAQKTGESKLPAVLQNIVTTPFAALMAIACSGLSLSSGFIRDDKYQIVTNQQIQSWDYLSRLLGSNLWSQSGGGRDIDFYRPLFSVWMLLVHTFGGLTPWLWHLSSILLHAIATYLVFLLGKRLLRNELGAFVTAIVFAVHPIHVDAVSWLSASCEILFAVFALASLLFFIPRSIGSEQRPSPVISALFYVAALASKETAVAILRVS